MRCCGTWQGSDHCLHPAPCLATFSAATRLATKRVQTLRWAKVGGKRKLFVPAHLAYGERQVGAHIKPNSNLQFEIELLEALTRDD